MLSRPRVQSAADAKEDTTKELIAAQASRKAEESYRDGDFAGAIAWWERCQPKARNLELIAAAHYILAKQAAAKGQWGVMEDHLQKAIHAARRPLHAQRLQFLRKRAPLMDDEPWAFLRSKVDPAVRLPPEHFAPEVTGVWSCGAYHAWSANRWLPWSRFLRLAKEAPTDTEEGRAALQIAGSFLCRSLFDETPLLAHVDVVVAVPANPARYERRMMSLPDELARAAASQLTLPFFLDALVSTAADDLELRGLLWWQRLEAIRGSMAAGDLGIARGASVLVVDDVTTSGATLREAARVLRAAGASDVYSMTLAHTEG